MIDRLCLTVAPATDNPRHGRQKAFAQKPSLSRRETEVLTWAARGKAASDISSILHISKRTVDAHARGAVRKLGALNRMHAVAIAVRDRLIEL